VPTALTTNDDWAYAAAAALAAVGILGTALGIRALRSGPLRDPGCSEAAYVAKIDGQKYESATTGRRAYEYMPYVIAASHHFGVPADVMAGLTHTESKWNPNAESGAGAIGIAQFLPATAKILRNQLLSKGDWPFGALDLYNPQQNTWLSAYYIKRLLRERDLEHAVAAYNAGGGAIKTDPPHKWPKQTQAYVPAVFKRAAWYRELWDECET